MSMAVNAPRNVTCPNCQAEGVGFREVEEVVTIRGERIPATRRYRHCESCGLDFENSRDPDWKVGAFDAYKRLKGYVTSDDLRTWRARLGLSQAEAGALLGFGEATIGRYEKGTLQTEVQNRALASVMTPAGLIEALERTPGVLSPERRAALVAAHGLPHALDAAHVLLDTATHKGLPPEFYGCSLVDFDRTATFIRRLADSGRNKTVLGAMMFESDFASYRQNGCSISGLSYEATPCGPLPINYPVILGLYAAVEMIRIDYRTVANQFVDVVCAGAREPKSYDFGVAENVIVAVSAGGDAGPLTKATSKSSWSSHHMGRPIPYTASLDACL